MAKFKIASAQIGRLKGSHQQFVRPETISGSDNDIDRAFEATRGFTAVTAENISRCQMTTITPSVDVKAKRGKGPGGQISWGDDTSFGGLIIDRVDEAVPRRFMVMFYINNDAIHGDEVDPQASLYLNSVTEVALHTKRIRRTHTDLIQRPTSNQGVSIMPNRVADRLMTTSHADGDTVTMLGGERGGMASTNIGDASNLVGDDALATCINAMAGSARVIGPRGIQTSRGEESAVLADLAEASARYVEEHQTADSELIDFLISGQYAAGRGLTITVSELQKALGAFKFHIATTDMGDKDYTQTSEMNTHVSAIAQWVINQVAGLMVKQTALTIRFGATNLDGEIVFQAANNWFGVMQTRDVQGLDEEAYATEVLQREATMRDQIRRLVLPKAFAAGEIEMIVDIQLLTVATIIIVMHGQRYTISIPTAVLSVWSTINAGDIQLSSNAQSQRNLLKAILNTQTAIDTKE